MEYKLTDKGNSARIAARLKGRIHYVHETGRWYIFNGRYWAEDMKEKVHQAADAVMEELGQEANELRTKALEAGSENAREELGDLATAIDKWVRHCESLARRQAMVAGLVLEPGVAIPLAEFDAKPHLLNCPNGTVDLRGGKLRAHRAEDMLTDCCPTKYDPAAKCPTWLKTIDLVTQGDKELAAYLQRVLGYAITGEVKEQSFFIFHGDGGNGKTTVLETVMAVVGGEYTTVVDPSLILERKFEAHPTEVANLRGRRLALTSETDVGRYLNEGLVKKLTGSTRMTARLMRQDFFTFEATHKLLLDTNNMPRIGGRDEGIWRRIKTLPFNAVIKERNFNIMEDLWREREGILAWLVEGARQWYQQGLGEPASVRAAVDAYKSDMDTVADWLEEHCLKGPEHRESLSKLHEVFVEVMREWGNPRPLGRPAFRDELIKRGFVAGRTGAGRFMQGLALKPRGLSNKAADDILAAAEAKGA